ncbi:hypothetical protein L1987_64082 [Smallanthus sonchifolius]|uniref:Uncharacterized protein n=1 Tax=Smallanthus sonchifolius TaxID=185202 RepID=A0ACB9CF05_9ASTR|nr:hypothetical protein L1987_64082 [Smallanthus sonchifolius]
MEIGFSEYLNATFEGTHIRHIDALVGEEKAAFSSFEDVDGMRDGLAHLIHKITCEVMFTEKIFALEIVPSMLSGMDSSVFSPSMAPDTVFKIKSRSHCNVLETKRLLTVWSKRVFVQSTPLERQACIFF